jgi:hypothetical protein
MQWWEETGAAQSQMKEEVQELAIGVLARRPDFLENAAAAVKSTAVKNKKTLSADARARQITFSMFLPPAELFDS